MLTWQERKANQSIKNRNVNGFDQILRRVDQLQRRERRLLHQSGRQGQEHNAIHQNRTGQSVPAQPRPASV